jgi:hypothetical protein
MRGLLCHGCDGECRAVDREEQIIGRAPERESPLFSAAENRQRNAVHEHHEAESGRAGECELEGAQCVRAAGARLEEASDGAGLPAVSVNARGDPRAGQRPFAYREAFRTPPSDDPGKPAAIEIAPRRAVTGLAASLLTIWQ